MTEDDDLERRLHSMLSGRADRVDPGESLDGATLRARSGQHQRSTRRTVAQSLVAAAAVAVIALATQLIPHETHHRTPPGQPAGVDNTTQVTTTPSPSTPTHHVTHPRTARPSSSAPARPSPATPSLDPSRTRTGLPRATSPVRSSSVTVGVPPAPPPASSRSERPTTRGSLSPARAATAARATSSPSG